jgi:hypothetical protein
MCLSHRLWWEAEAERIKVPGQSRQKKFARPILTEKSWVWWLSSKNDRWIMVQASLGKKQNPISKTTEEEELEVWLKWYST